MPEIKLYNSLTRKKEVFKPLDPAHVKLYACGPTVYSYAHIGNGMMAVVFDVLNRVLKSIYPKVTYVSNITDIEDKIIIASRETGEPIDVLTRKYERIYNEDMAVLGCAAPDVQPRATQHITEMIALIETLIENDNAYEADGHVLFHVPSFPKYGGLSGRSRDEQVAGSRVEVASYKKDAADFVLWKPSSGDEPGWKSPWGFGRPGWHIECSAMAEKHLGLPFDIHGGGADLKFPHHENEIAQSCCAHGSNDLAAFARVWVHNGFITVDGQKMSKSLGNFLLVHDLIQDYAGEVLRFTILTSHYRQPMDWSDSKLAQSQKQLDKFYSRLNEMIDMTAEDAAVPAGIMAALCDDLNTPQVIAELNVLLKMPNSPALKGALLAAGNILGIFQSDAKQWCGFGCDDDAAIDALLTERDAAKSNKNFARADEIRDELAIKGIEIIDTPKGAKWRKV